MKKIFFTEKLIEQTRDGYNRMAKDWAGTRMNFWSELTGLVVDQIQKGQGLTSGAPEGRPATRNIAKVQLLDLGCGNARFYREISHLPVTYRGSDISAELIAQAHKYHPELDLTCSDARHTPYADNSFDIIVSFAVMHHFPGKAAQTEFLREVERLLVPGGTAIITVWNIWKTKKKLIWKQFLHKLFTHESLALGDVLMDFTHHKGTRFVHAFTKRELRQLVQKTSLQIKSLETIARASKKGCEENFVLVLKKLAA